MKMPKDKLRRLEIMSVVTIGFIIIAMFVFPNLKVPVFKDNPAIPKITGYVSADMFSQNLNLEFSESIKYTLSTNSEEQFIISSLRIDGAVKGNGVVKITLVDSSGNSYLIYSNVKKDIGKGNLITGMATADIGNTEENSISLELTPVENLPGFISTPKKGYSAVSGSFTNECVDTCYIGLSLSKDITYDLLFEIEEDTTLILDSITYTLAQ